MEPYIKKTNNIPSEDFFNIIFILFVIGIFVMIVSSSQIRKLIFYWYYYWILLISTKATPFPLISKETKIEFEKKLTENENYDSTKYHLFKDPESDENMKNLKGRMDDAKNLFNNIYLQDLINSITNFLKNPLYLISTAIFIVMLVTLSSISMCKNHNIYDISKPSQLFIPVSIICWGVAIFLILLGSYSSVDFNEFLKEKPILNGIITSIKKIIGALAINFPKSDDSDTCNGDGLDLKLPKSLSVNTQVNPLVNTQVNPLVNTQVNPLVATLGVATAITAVASTHDKVK
jgi:hypothetical protein